jgi:hypothetical protein
MKVGMDILGSKERKDPQGMAIFHHMAKNKDGLQLVQMETLQGSKEEKGAQGTSPTSQGILIYDTPLCFQPIQLLDSP